MVDEQSLPEAAAFPESTKNKLIKSYKHSRLEQTSPPSLKTTSYSTEKYLILPSQTTIIRNKIAWLHADSQIVNNNNLSQTGSDSVKLTPQQILKIY